MTKKNIYNIKNKDIVIMLIKKSKAKFLKRIIELIDNNGTVDDKRPVTLDLMLIWAIRFGNNDLKGGLIKQYKVNNKLILETFTLKEIFLSNKTSVIIEMFKLGNNINDEILKALGEDTNVLLAKGGKYKKIWKILKWMEDTKIDRSKSLSLAQINLMKIQLGF